MGARQGFALGSLLVQYIPRQPFLVGASGKILHILEVYDVSVVAVTDVVDVPPHRPPAARNC